MPAEENASLLFLQSIVIDKKKLTINIWQLNSITQNKNTRELLKKKEKTVKEKMQNHVNQL